MALNFCAKGSKKRGKNFRDEITCIARLVKAIEINCNYPQYSDFGEELKFLKKLTKEWGVQFVVHAPYLNSSLGDLNPELNKQALEEVYSAIDRACYLESDLVTIHPPFDPYGIYFKEKEEIELETYKKIADYALNRNVRIGLENEAQTCFFFPDRACQFELIRKTVDTINRDNFGYTLDIGHANISKVKASEAIAQSSTKLFHIHAHDNYGQEDLHLAPGDGNIDWQIILEALAKIQYNRFFEIETDLKDIDKGKGYLLKLL